VIKKFGFDIDGIVLNTQQITLNKFNQLFSTNIRVENWITYNFEDCFNYPREMILEAFEKGIIENKDSPIFYPNAIDTLQFFADNIDSPITFVTNRRETWASIAEAQIKEHVQRDIIVNYKEAALEKQNIGKTDRLKSLGIEIFIEDDPSWWIEYLDNGIEVWTLERLYNKEMVRYAQRSYGDRFKCFLTWDDILVELYLLSNYQERFKASGK
jgi:hypothetical protein